VTTLDSITYLDEDDVEQTVDSGDYTLDISSGMAKVRVTESWPTTNGGLSSTVITYTAGYADADSVPEVIKQAIKATVATLYEHRGDDGHGGLPLMATDLLDSVKVYWNAEM
jgi:uncharacterized phiE125 gp8 family phage protein